MPARTEEFALVVVRFFGFLETGASAELLDQFVAEPVDGRGDDPARILKVAGIDVRSPDVGFDQHLTPHPERAAEADVLVDGVEPLAQFRCRFNVRDSDAEHLDHRVVWIDDPHIEGRAAVGDR